MATFTKTYPNTGSTLEIEYPEKLFKFVGEPTDYYQDDRVESSLEQNGDLTYPDAILLPENGSSINLIVKVVTKEFKAYLVHKDIDGQWVTEISADSSASPSDPSYVPGYPDEEEG